MSYLFSILSLSPVPTLQGKLTLAVCIHDLIHTFRVFPGRKERVSSLQSLVCWYQEHSCSCPHEPRLRGLEPQLNFSTAATWQCDSDHSFVQYLFSPPREESDSEREAEPDGNGQDAAITDGLVARGAAGRKRRKEAHKRFQGASS